VLAFDARAPRFDGMLTLSTPASASTPISAKSDAKPAGGAAEPSQLPPSQIPWRIVSKVKADSTGATLEQIEASYGAEERALKLIGLGDIRFGATPLLHASLSARQLDADRLVAKDKDKNGDKAAQPLRLLSGLRALVAAVPPLPIPTQI
jgi:hypothetical protein